MEKKRENFDFATDLASLRPQLIRRAEDRWSKRFWRELSPEDFVSETICLALQNRESFRGSTLAELVGYAQSILDNLLTSWGIRLARRPLHELFDSGKHKRRTQGTTPSGKLMRIELRIEVASALGLLTPLERRAIELIRVEEKTYKEACAELGIPEYTLYRLIPKVEAKLERHFRDR
jgi:RNA polymerase sigma factor (sigma-70 family)